MGQSCKETSQRTGAVYVSERGLSAVCVLLLCTAVRVIGRGERRGLHGLHGLIRLMI